MKKKWPYKRCKLCKMTRVLNKYRVCRQCEPDWRQEVDAKKQYKEYAQETYDRMMDEGHEGVCDICGSEPITRRLAIDHDHKTGKIRGLLCYRCNYGLGWFKEKSEILFNAAEYIKRHEI